MHVYGHANATTCTWRSKDNFQYFIHSFRGIWGLNSGCLACAGSTVTCWAILLAPNLGATTYDFMTDLWFDWIWLETVTRAIILALVKYIAAHLVEFLVLDVMSHPHRGHQMVFVHKSFFMSVYIHPYEHLCVCLWRSEDELG